MRILTDRIPFIGITTVLKGLQCRSIEPVLVATLRDEVLLELSEELEVEEVVGRQRFLAHHGLHRLYIFADRIARVKLV